MHKAAPEGIFGWCFALATGVRWRTALFRMIRQGRTKPKCQLHVTASLGIPRTPSVIRKHGETSSSRITYLSIINGFRSRYGRLLEHGAGSISSQGPPALSTGKG